MLVVYLTLTAFVAANHEPWRDEADPWLVARDNDFAGTVTRARYAGFPPTWHLSLKALCEFGLPYQSMGALNLLFSAAAVAMLLFFAPMPRTLKVLIVFSYFFAYEYAVVARPYALGIFLLFAALAMFRRNATACAVLLALSMNVAPHVTLLSVATAVAFLIERRPGVKPAVIIALGALLCAVQLRIPAADAQRVGADHVLNLPAVPFVIGHGLLPTIPMAAGAPLALAVLAFLTFALRKSVPALLALWLSIAGLATLSAFVWTGGLRHAGFVTVAAIVAMWIGERDHLAVRLALAVSCLVAVSYWYDEVRLPFSGAKEMAAVLRDNRLPVAAHNLTQCEAVLPYLGDHSRFWYAGLEREGSHMMWDRELDRAVDTPYPVAVERARRHFAGHPWLLLLNVQMPNPAQNGFRLIHSTQVPFEKTDEQFWLYAPLRPAAALR